MQSIGVFVLETLKHSAMKKFGKKSFEGQFGYLSNLSNGDKLICPLCHYESKKNRSSAKIFKDADGTSFKCFSCGAWRLVK